MNEHLLLAFGIIKAHLVVTPSTGRRAGLDSAHLVVLRVLGVGTVAKVRRHLVGIVNATHDDRLVGIAFPKVYDHFLAYSRPKTCSPSSPGPELADAYPTRTVGAVLALTVPVKLNLHPAVLVRENFFAGRADDDRCLRTGNRRLGCHARGSER